MSLQLSRAEHCKQVHIIFTAYFSLTERTTDFPQCSGIRCSSAAGQQPRLASRQLTCVISCS